MERINGVPINGAIAYKEGFFAADCPYMEEDDLDFNRWNTEWDQAADEATAPPQPKGPGSVITGRYRAKYSEDGHPTHCGDELAVLLNEMCSNKAGTNLEVFEHICDLNGIDLSKYNRSTKGWQGRLRMTGRNLLSKKVAKRGGWLIVPYGLDAEKRQLSQEWVESTLSKYKPKVYT